MIGDHRAETVTNGIGASFAHFPRVIADAQITLQLCGPLHSRLNDHVSLHRPPGIPEIPPALQRPQVLAAAAFLAQSGDHVVDSDGQARGEYCARNNRSAGPPEVGFLCALGFSRWPIPSTIDGSTGLSIRGLGIWLKD